MGRIGRTTATVSLHITATSPRTRISRQFPTATITMKPSYALLLAPAALANAQITEIVDGVESVVDDITSGAGSVYTYLTSNAGSEYTVVASGAEGVFSTVTDRVESAATAFATDVTSVG